MKDPICGLFSYWSKNDSICKPLLLLVKKNPFKYRVKANTVLILFHKCVSILRAVITLFGDSIFAQIFYLWANNRYDAVPLMGVAPWACRRKDKRRKFEQTLFIWRMFLVGSVHFGEDIMSALHFEKQIRIFINLSSKTSE